MHNQWAPVLSGFVLCGILIVFTLGKSPIFRVDRAGISIIGAVALIGFNVISFDEAVKSVDYKTIVILFAMMVVLANLKLAGFFDLVGNIVLEKVSTQKGLLLSTILVSGTLPAIAINDVVCLLFTPVVLMICRKGQCNPLPHLIGLATASNIGSAATLLGNPQNILITSLSGLPFFSYCVVAGPMALLGLAITYLILLFVYKNDLQGVISDAVTTEKTIVHMYLIRKSIIILGCILVAYMGGYDLALAASFGAAVILITRRINPSKIYANVDFNLLMLFIGLFVIVGSVERSGLMEYAMNMLSIKDTLSIPVFALLTVIVSNVISNVPAVLLLKFLIPQGDAAHWWTALALFSTLAGNLTITGSIANLIVVEMAKQQGITVPAKEYFKIGFPLTIITVLLSIAWLALLGK